MAAVRSKPLGLLGWLLSILLDRTVGNSVESDAPTQAKMA
jgi:hypothetical protein